MHHPSVYSHAALRYTIVLLVVFSYVNAFTAAYHVATRGSDTGHDGSPHAPFRTVSHAASLMGPGDTCYIHAGVYREKVTVSASGTPQAPVVFRAAAGERVILSGADTLAGWRPWTEDIYAAPYDGRRFDQLFVQRRMMIEAGWPNQTLDPMDPQWAYAQAGTRMEDGVLVDPLLPAVDWTGAILHAARRSNAWFHWCSRIETSAPGRLTFGNITRRAQGRGHYRLFRGPLSMLDSRYEWHFNPDSARVYLWPPQGFDPASHTVAYKSRKWAFDLGTHDHIHIHDIDIFAAGINMHGNHCLVQGCRIRHSYHDYLTVREVETPAWATGIHVSGHGNTFRDCAMGYSSSFICRVSGSHHTFVNCLLHDGVYMGGHGSSLHCYGAGHIIDSCTIVRSARCLLTSEFTGGRVSYNHLYEAMRYCNDGGAIYVHSHDAQGTEYCYNWLHHVHTYDNPNIVYFDGSCTGVLIHHNVIWYGGRGIFVKAGGRDGDILLYNNTIFENGSSVAISIWDYEAGLLAIHNNLTVNRVPELRPYGAHMQSNYRSDALSSILRDPDGHDFRPVSGADSIIDRGHPIAGITDDFTGDGPDIGAYEYGAEPWVPGARGVTPWLVQDESLPNAAAKRPGHTPQRPEPSLTPRNLADIHRLIHGNTPVLVRLFDMHGRLVFCSSPSSRVSDVPQALSRLPRGLYIVLVRRPAATTVQRFVLTHR